MGILDGIVEWLAEQVMYALDLVSTSVLGALGCDMSAFLRYFPAAKTLYGVFVALAIGLILLNWVWQLFRNFGLGVGTEAEDPVKLSLRSVLFLLLVWFSDDIVNIVLKIGGTPLRLDHGRGLARGALCELQLGHAHDPRRLRQRRGGPDRPDPGADPGLELPQAIAGGCRAVCAAGGSGVHRAGGFRYGRVPVYGQHLPILVPDAGRADPFADHERLVPAAVHLYGRHLPRKPAFTLNSVYTSDMV